MDQISSGRVTEILKGQVARQKDFKIDEAFRRCVASKSTQSRNQNWPSSLIEPDLSARTFRPESGHVRCNLVCPLWANSGRHFGGVGIADEWWSTILQSLPSFTYVRL